MLPWELEREVAEVKSVCCFKRGWEFGFSAPIQGSSQLPRTPAPGNLMLSSGLCGHMHSPPQIQIKISLKQLAVPWGLYCQAFLSESPGLYTELFNTILTLSAQKTQPARRWKPCSIHHGKMYKGRRFTEHLLCTRDFSHLSLLSFLSNLWNGHYYSTLQMRKPRLREKEQYRSGHTIMEAEHVVGLKSCCLLLLSYWRLYWHLSLHYKRYDHAKACRKQWNI